MTEIHQGSLGRLREDHVFVTSTRAPRARRHGRSAMRTTPSRRRRFTFATSSRLVPFVPTMTGSPARDAARVRVGRGQLDLGERPLEGERLDPLHLAAAEERAPGRELEACAAGLVLGERLELRRVVELRARRKLRLLGRGGVVRPARDRDAERVAELGEELELVEERRVDRAAQALRAPLEVDRRAVLLQVGGSRDDEVRPERVVAREHRRAEDEARALGELGDARIVRGAVPGDDERAQLALGQVGRAAVSGLVPDARDAAAVRRARKDVEPGAVAEIQRRGQRGAAPAVVVVVARPDDRHPARLAQPPRQAGQLLLGVVADEVVADRRRAAGRDGDRPGGVHGDDLGAVSPRGPQPEIDDRARARSPARPRGRGRSRRRGSRRAARGRRPRPGRGRPAGSRRAPRARRARAAPARGPARRSRCRRTRRRSSRRPRAARARPPRRPGRSRPPRTRGAARAGAARESGRAAFTWSKPKRPLSQIQPSSTSGWFRERIRCTLPSRVVAQTLQPVGQSPQTVGTLSISQGRARKR